MKGQLLAVAATAAVASAQMYPIMPRAGSASALFTTITYTTCSQEPDVSAPAASGGNRQGAFPFTTVYTTVYTDVCTCTEGVEEKTYTITEGCSKPPSPTWSFPREHIPPGFTCTTVMCESCPQGPTPIPVTRPVPTPARAPTPAPYVPNGGSPAPAPAPAGCAGPGCPAPAPAPVAPSGAMPPMMTGSRGGNSSNIPNITPAFSQAPSLFSIDYKLVLVSVLTGLISAGAFLL